VIDRIVQNETPQILPLPALAAQPIDVVVEQLVAISERAPLPAQATSSPPEASAGVSRGSRTYDARGSLPRLGQCCSYVIHEEAGLGKLRGCGGLGAWPLAAAGAVAEAVQSSIRPRGAGQCAVRGSGAQSSAAAVLWERGQT
jgi:hypothetical protein